MKQPTSLNDSLLKAARSYHDQIAGSPAESYLIEDRGLSGEAIRRFGLGFSGDPEPGHEKVSGRLSIPYLRRTATGGRSVVDIRFRTLTDSPAKYLSLPGSRSRLFNTEAALDNDDTIAITEGELDAISASMNEIPAIGVAGAKAWKDYFTDLFIGYRVVWVLADGDPPGIAFAEDIASRLGNVRILRMPDGEDVSSVIASRGAVWIKERMT